jgi:hypothetical protein
LNCMGSRIAGKQFRDISLSDAVKKVLPGSAASRAAERCRRSCGRILCRKLDST